MKLLKLLLIFTFSLSALAGEFNVLTYNVAGLPKLVGKKNGQNGEKLHPYISPLLNDFSIVLVQEDFSYHKLLTKYAVHPYKSKFGKNGFFRLGDGLNRLSSFPFHGFSRKKWTKCFGSLIRKFGGDCLTPKGFSVATHELEPGVFVDVYNHHGEAGSSNGDEKAKRKNVRQFIDFVKNHSEGRAVILAGDFNLHEKKPIDKRHLDNILTSLNLIDTCMELECVGPDNIDKIFYRSGHGIDLKVLEWTNANELFKDEKGNRLSDHPPISAKFSWQKSEDHLRRVISLKALHSGLCIGRGEDDKAIQVDCQERAEFEVIPSTHYSVALMDITSKKCLEIKWGSKRNRRDLIFGPCHFKDYQRFFLNHLSYGKLHILMAQHSGKCLDVKKSDKNPGAQIIQYKCEQGDNQLWDVIEKELNP